MGATSDRPPAAAACILTPWPHARTPDVPPGVPMHSCKLGPLEAAGMPPLCRWDRPCTPQPNQQGASRHSHVPSPPRADGDLGAGFGALQSQLHREAKHSPGGRTAAAREPCSCNAGQQGRGTVPESEGPRCPHRSGGPRSAQRLLLPVRHWRRALARGGATRWRPAGARGPGAARRAT